jgi:hypothetical protein
MVDRSSPGSDVGTGVGGGLDLFCAFTGGVEKGAQF